MFPSVFQRKLKARFLHRQWLYVAFFAMLTWCLSGVLHPLMSAVGIQQTVFSPPTALMELADTRSIKSILQTAHIEQPLAVQVLPYAGQPVLQVSTDALAPRRYFNLQTGVEIPDQDMRQAEFAVQHYMGLKPTDHPAKVSFQQTFDTAYPAVNRLLPVYKLEYPNVNGLVAYVYTENNSLASVSNTPKRIMQTTFQWLHTWSWLPEWLEPLRLVIVGLCMLSLLIMALTGLRMLLGQPQRAVVSKRPWPRRVHRAAGWLLVVPLVAWSGSGVFHLINQRLHPAEFNLHLSPPLNLALLQHDIQSHWVEDTRGLSLAGLSLVQTPQGELLYRLGMTLVSTSQAVPVLPDAIRNARFDGVTISGPALYVNATTGAAWLPGDRELAIQLAQRFIGNPTATPESVHLINRFGGDYDFRNKRLPVWKVQYGEPLNKTLFIDTRNGVLADVARHSDRPERWSFSNLHKWNFIQPLGRSFQNWGTAVTALLMVIFLAGLGLLKLRKRSITTRSSHASP
ncbi:MAG TPA: hypothetical protein VGE55_09080 [Limnobacter sp.]|uniref:hypothetical protein n=1 Tax=Limnobacter sp. TaxID=2003368 RepID=UPI002ED7FB97